MWARVVEIMTAVWLAASPFAFGVQSDPRTLWTNLFLALAICVFSGLSYWKPTRYAYLLNLLVATGLALWGRFAVSPPTPIHENQIVVGLFLLMIALIPNEASLPPLEWRRKMDVPPRGR